MTYHSQNGYVAGVTSLIGKYTVPGTTPAVKLNLMKGDVSVVLLDFAAWFDNNIEHLVQDQCGGYNFRPIADSTTLSNHASGTAEDLNWSKHPMGKKGTFTAAQTAKIRERLKFYEGVLRWGGDYGGRIDEMHFEINKPPAAVKKVADKIRGIKTYVHPAGSRQLQYKAGEKVQDGHDVKVVQAKVAMAAKSQDGLYGPATAKAVKNWQLKHMPKGSDDGIVGKKTWAAMGIKPTF